MPPTAPDPITDQDLIKLREQALAQHPGIAEIELAYGNFEQYQQAAAAYLGGVTEQPSPRSASHTEAR